MNKILYSKDSKGKIRCWEIKTEKNYYYQRSGLITGRITDWIGVKCKGKNLGKSNQTTDEQQAISEAENLINKKLKENYFHTQKEAEETEKEFRPMLATKWSDREKKVTFPVLSQPKLDGARCNIYMKNGEIKAFSREGRPFFVFDHIIEALKPIFDKYPNIIFDGEGYSHEYRNNFEDLMSIIRQQKPSINEITIAKENLQYHIYDYHDNLDTYNLERSLILPRMLDEIKNEKCIVIVPSKIVNSKEEFQIHLNKYLEEGYEGMMIRSFNAIYKVDGRSNDLIKVKLFEDEEFEIIDVLEGNGAWKGCAKMVTVLLDNGKTCEASLKGTQAKLREVLQNKENYIGKKATVTFFGRTNDDKLRFPVVKDINRGND